MGWINIWQGSIGGLRHVPGDWLLHAATAREGDKGSKLMEKAVAYLATGTFPHDAPDILEFLSEETRHWIKSLHHLMKQEWMCRTAAMYIDGDIYFNYGLWRDYGEELEGRHEDGEASGIGGEDSGDTEGRGEECLCGADVDPEPAYRPLTADELDMLPKINTPFGGNGHGLFGGLFPPKRFI